MKEVINHNEEKQVVTVVLRDYEEDLFSILSKNSYDPIINHLEIIRITDRLSKLHGPLVGKATCHKGDEFDYSTGYRLAASRASRQFFGVVKEGFRILLRRSHKITELYEDALEDIITTSDLIKSMPCSRKPDEDNADE